MENASDVRTILMTQLTRSESNRPRLAKNSVEPENSSIAVAIAHKPTGPNSLPKVVASGRGTTADKILEIAFAEGVKVREDSDLAELLAAADIDSEIPTEAFIAVAEILRYVYMANGAQPPEAG
tara:strand:- start:897 stop:1268 length:372 start_codon:yes stop_codon:yes gene_type:complete